jgi:hypothetical protein
MSKKPNSDHVSFRNGKLFCYHCGRSFDMQYPQKVSFVTAILKEYANAHADCPKTWTEPPPPADLNEIDRALWWFTDENGERGMSSEAIWYVMTRTLQVERVISHDPHAEQRLTMCRIKIIEEGHSGAHPHDPDDLHRCYKLLQIIPEWKNKMHEMKSVSAVWGKLVENWDVLIELLVAQLDGKENNLGQMMRDLGC